MARGLAILIVLKYAGVCALELPDLKERRPVDVAGKLGEIVALEGARAEEARLRRRIVLPIELEAVGTCVGNRRACLLRPAAGVRFRYARIFLAHPSNRLWPLFRRHQAGYDADGAARVGDVDSLTAVVV